jgi:ATP-dependent Lhr-like helicase
MLFLRDHAADLLPPCGEAPADIEHDRIRSLLNSRGACFFRELVANDSQETLEALWDLVWAGHVTNDSFSPVRGAPGPRQPRSRPGRGSLSTLGPPRSRGRWTLVERELLAATPNPTRALHTRALTLLNRHGVLTRESVRGEGSPGGYAAVYPVLRSMEESGRTRRGYFVRGLGGAQFALPGAVDRLRSFRDAVDVLVLAATDPANAYGLALPWPVKGPQRAAGAYVVIVGGLASLYLERGGRRLLALREPDGAWEDAALEGLIKLGRLTLTHYPDELASRLTALGFVPTPKGLVRHA